MQVSAVSQRGTKYGECQIYLEVCFHMLSGRINFPFKIHSATSYGHKIFTILVQCWGLTVYQEHNRKCCDRGCSC